MNIESYITVDRKSLIERIEKIQEVLEIIRVHEFQEWQNTFREWRKKRNLVAKIFYFKKWRILMKYTEDDIDNKDKMARAWRWIHDSWQDAPWERKWSGVREMEELYLQIIVEDIKPDVLLSTTHANCVTKMHNRLVETEWMEE